METFYRDENETIYSVNNTSVRVIGTRAAVWTPKADFFGTEAVTIFVNVQKNEDGTMKDATCVGRKTFKTTTGAARFSNIHLRGRA